jgi:hypothetical protein
VELLLLDAVAALLLLVWLGALLVKGFAAGLSQLESLLPAGLLTDELGSCLARNTPVPPTAPGVLAAAVAAAVAAAELGGAFHPGAGKPLVRSAFVTGL